MPCHTYHKQSLSSLLGYVFANDVVANESFGQSTGDKVHNEKVCLWHVHIADGASEIQLVEMFDRKYCNGTFCPL